MSSISIRALLIDADNGEILSSGATVSYLYSNQTFSLPIGETVVVTEDGSKEDIIDISCTTATEYSFSSSTLITKEYDGENSIVISAVESDVGDIKNIVPLSNSDKGFNVLIEIKVTIGRKTKNLHYDMNGGSGGPSDSTFTAGKSFRISSTKPTNSGSTFYRWSTASGEVFASGSNVTFQSDTVLYAMWSSTDYPKRNYYDRLVYKV